MTEIEEVMAALRRFTDERDWEQFHDGKNLALALSIEAAELNEAFLWKSAEDVDLDKVKEELADVFNYAFHIAMKYNLDVKDICMAKIVSICLQFLIFKSTTQACSV